MSKFFQAGALNIDALAAYGMGAKPDAAMLESAKASAEPELQVKKPKQELSLEQAHQMILEAVAASVKSDGLSDAAQAVLDWADSDDTSYDALDGFAQSLAGIDDDVDEPTEAELDAYYDVLSNMANFMVAAGADEDTVSVMFDDEDDDASNELAAALKQIDADDRASLVSAFALSGDDAMTEALVKVVRGGKWMSIRKPFKKRRRTAAQRMALKLAQRKSHTAQAKLHRGKSMKIRAKRLGK
jgi:hypothetical protein